MAGDPPMDAADSHDALFRLRDRASGAAECLTVMLALLPDPRQRTLFHDQVNNCKNALIKVIGSFMSPSSATADDKATPAQTVLPTPESNIAEFAALPFALHPTAQSDAKALPTLTASAVAETKLPKSARPPVVPPPSFANAESMPKRTVLPLPNLKRTKIVNPPKGPRHDSSRMTPASSTFKFYPETTSKPAMTFEFSGNIIMNFYGNTKRSVVEVQSPRPRPVASTTVSRSSSQPIRRPVDNAAYYSGRAKEWNNLNVQVQKWLTDIGRIEETDAGMNAGVACENCTRWGRPCKIFKPGVIDTWGNSPLPTCSACRFWCSQGPCSFTTAKRRAQTQAQPAAKRLKVDHNGGWRPS